MAKTDPLKKLRQIIDTLPDTSETLSHGAPTFWAGKKTFARFHSGGYDDGRPGVWMKAPAGAQEALIESDPDRFYRPKYLGPSGWIAMRLVGKVDWVEVRSLLVQGYRLVAPKRALAALDGGPTTKKKSASTPVFGKLQLGDRAHLLVVRAPPEFKETLGALDGREVQTNLRRKGPFEFVLVFVQTCEQIAGIAEKVTARAGDDGLLWFAYPKKSSKNVTTDISRDQGWQPLGDLGFEPVRQIAIDGDWSALRFRRAENIKTMTRQKKHALSAKGRARSR